MALILNTFKIILISLFFYSKCCHTSKKASYIMVPSLQRSAMRSSASQSSQNKTYVRLSMKQPQDQQLTSIPTATAGAFSCYQTLIDINNSKYHTHETGKNIFIRYLWRFFDCLAYPNLSATLATDQKLPLSFHCISYQSLAKCHLP